MTEKEAIPPGIKSQDSSPVVFIENHTQYGNDPQKIIGIVTSCFR